jgi:hypothetical protein
MKEVFGGQMNDPVKVIPAKRHAHQPLVRLVLQAHTYDLIVNRLPKSVNPEKIGAGIRPSYWIFDLLAKVFELC